MPDEPTTAGSSEPGETSSSAAEQPKEQPRDERGRFTREEQVPEWAVGRTPAEVATIADQLWRQSMTAPAQQPTPQQPAQQPQQQPHQQPIQVPQQGTPMPTADDWATDPAMASQRFASYMQEQQAPQFAQLQGQMGMQARSAAEMRFANEFKRWGPDIDTRLKQYLPDPSQWTPQAIEAVVGVVRGEHANEIANEMAEERVQELIAQGGSGLARSDAGGVGPGVSPPNTLDFTSDELPPERRQLLQMTGATPQALDELLRKFYPNESLEKAREKWYAAAKKGDVLAEYHAKSEPARAPGGPTDQRVTGITVND